MSNKDIFEGLHDQGYDKEEKYFKELEREQIKKMRDKEEKAKEENPKA